MTTALSGDERIDVLLRKRGVHELPDGHCPTTPAAAGYAYFAQADRDGPIKIGWSRLPWGRVRRLHWQTGDRVILLGLVDGGRAVERLLHRRFAPHRLEGEWFAPAPELLDFIRSSTEAP